MHATITDDSFTAEVLEADTTVVVDFHAPWCAPCRVMDRALDELAPERPDLRFVRLDIDDNPRTAAQYGVMSVPTLIAFRHGQPVLQLTGARPKSAIERELDKVLAATA